MRRAYYTRRSIQSTKKKIFKKSGTEKGTTDFLKILQKFLMSITQKEGIVICVPKGDKPREYLKNWRPISLLNVTYDIGSPCIANRLKTLLPNLISKDQSLLLEGTLGTIYVFSMV